MRMKNILANGLHIISLLLIIISFSVGSCKKVKKADPLSSLDISNNINACRKGDTIHFKSTYNPHSDVMPDFTWESSNKNILTLKNDGTAIALDSGKVIVTLLVNDGTGLTSSKAIYVFGKPSISIISVTDITYFSANFIVQSDLGGGNNTNTLCGFVWDTVPKLDTAKAVGQITNIGFSIKTNIDLFDDGKKFYVRAFIKTPIDIVYSESVQVTTLPLPNGIVGNYMLNSSLAYGLVCKSNDWIYYNNSSDNNFLYRIKNDLTGKQKIGNVEGVGSINILGSNIYCTGAEPKEFQTRHDHFITLKLDGSKLKNTIGKFNYYLYAWRTSMLYNNYIYPSNSYLFRFSTITKDSIPRLGFTNGFNVFNNKLYFSLLRKNDSDSLYTINQSNLDGSDIKEIHRGYNPYIFKSNDLAIYKNYAYFRENDIFKKIDLDFPNIVKTISISTSSYNKLCH